MICKFCNNLYETRYNYSKKYLAKRKYCSRKCFRLDIPNNPTVFKNGHSPLRDQIGEKNSMWRGGITPLLEKIRSSRKYDRWRKEILKRDNFTCIICKNKGGWNRRLKKRIFLQADHFKPFSLYPELRFCLNNGRTLCIDCHKKTPTFGMNIKYLNFY